MRVFSGEMFQGGVDGGSLFVGQAGGVGAGEVEALPAASVFGAAFAAGVLDQDAAHGFRGGGEEVTAAVPVETVGGPDQAEVGLVDEGGGLQGLVGGLGRHPCGS